MKRTSATKRIVSICLILAMLLAFIPVTAPEVTAASTPTVLYLKPNSNWTQANARFAAYFFGNGETWASMSDSDGDGVYEAEVPPGGYTKVIFCRMNPSATDNNWNNKWNQTADLTIPTGNNCYTVANNTWDNGGGTWSCIHDYDSGTVTTQPTCTAAGERTYTCEVCGDTETESVAATGHTWGDASCTSAATCTVCGATSGSAIGHNYVYSVTKTPTTSASGTLKGTCSRCSGTTTVTLPKLSTTDYSYAVVSPASCTATGTGRYTWKTTTYGTYSFDVTIAKTSHSYADATCTEPQTCTGCGATTGSALGHDYVNGKCTVCDAYDDVAFLMGINGDWANGIEMAKNSDGKYSATVTLASGDHTFKFKYQDSWYGLKTERVTGDITGWWVYLPTNSLGNSNITLGVDEGGTYTFTFYNMSGDHAVMDISSVKCVHSYTSEVTTPASCTAAGVRTYTCSKCNHIYTEEIAKLDHSYDDGVVTTPATCAAAGVRTYTCSECGGTYTEAIPATGEHNYVNGKCSVCDTWETWVYLMGEAFGGWADGTRMTKDGSIYSYTLALTAGSYDFKIRETGVLMGNNGDIADTTETSSAGLGWKMEAGTDYGDCTLIATGGTYTFSYNIDTNFLIITHVACTHSSHNQDGSCPDCGTTNENNHSYLAKETVPPTCADQGYTVYECSCGKTKQADFVDATGEHSYANGACTVCGQALPTVKISGDMNSWATPEMTSNGDGTYTYTVTLSNGSYRFKILEDGIWLGNNATIADATTTGWTMTADAGDCTLTATGGVYTFTYDYNTHKLSVSREECTHPGHKQDGTCTLCGEALGHDYTHKSVTVQPTCVSKGYTASYCACGAYQISGYTTKTDTHSVVNGVCVDCGLVMGFYLSGQMNEWTPALMSGSGDTVSITMHLDYGTYEFKLLHRTADGSDWLGNSGTITDTCDGWTMTAEASNCTITAKGGTYTFTYNTSTNELTVTCEECGHTSHDTDGNCTDCGNPVGHSYTDGKCVCGLEEGKRIIYFDATLSKLTYTTGEVTNNYSMPYGSNSIWVHYWVDGQATGYGSVEMTKVAKTVDGHTYSDVWMASIPASATHVNFYSGCNYDEASSRATADQMLVADASCFYANSSDDAIYNGSERGGYWGDPYEIRDPEYVADKDIVDISKTETFQQKVDTIYFGATLYDYFTDFELNGSNRDNYKGLTGNQFASYRSYAPFRHFNQALSDYYAANSVLQPIYTGHFQPEWDGWGYQFNDIAQTLKLYGFKDGLAYDATDMDQKWFMAVNNSYMDVTLQSGVYNSATWGLVDSTLSSSDSLLTSGAEMPYFNEAFLRGDNSKNATLAQIYENVQFPFTKEKDENGVYYWVFDSEKTTLQLKQDANDGSYYMDEVTDSTEREKYKNLDAGSNKLTTYGFFPFNSGATAGDANTYNYGFGARMDLTFNLSEDGLILAEDGTPHETVFEFYGDDDLWIFIDGKLVLDVGGSHSKVTGTINFATLTATVSSVKANGVVDVSGTNMEKAFTIDGNMTDDHTLTLFFMERGMWESNMKVSFNFTPKDNSMPTTTLAATKEWSVQDVEIAPVQIQLQRKTATSAWENVGEVITLSADNNWTYSFVAINRFADAARTIEYQYRAVELSNGKVMENGEFIGEDLVVTYTTIGNSATGYTQKIVNLEIENQSIVIDFGIPVDIDVFQSGAVPNGTLVGIGDTSKVVDGIYTAMDTDLSENFMGKYGKAKIENGKLRYTPGSMNMSAPEMISYAVKYTDESGVTYYYHGTVTIIPAANIYYEDYFLSFTNSSVATGTFGTWTAATAHNGSIQTDDRPGATDSVYGYDSAYGSFNTYSLGAGRKVTVDMATGSKANAPTASFTFTGTGFDVIGVTDSTSGAITVEVRQGSTLVRSYIVNNYYGMVYENGKWKLDEDATGALYQVPVIKVTGLTYGSYSVTIRAAYLPFMDVANKGSYTIWLDAIRVYNPAQGNTTAEGAYSQDGESNPHLTTVKDLLVSAGSFTAGSSANGVVYIDGMSSDVQIADYSDPGPNNETYLKGTGTSTSNAIGFKLRYTGSGQPDVSLQIGAKLAAGSSVDLYCNSTKLSTLTTATNMFYELSGVTWSRNGEYWESSVIIISCRNADTSSILSLTDIKVTGADAAKIQGATASQAEEAAILVAYVDNEVRESAMTILGDSSGSGGVDVKWQISKDTTAESESTNLRLVSYVDSLDYTGITFRVTVGGNTVDYVCTSVLSNILAGDSVISGASAVFGEDALYFTTVSLVDVPAAAFDTEITVEVIWETLEGELIYGSPRTFVIADALG